eukprot:c18224_g1_i1.p1 GENE.c18224_g1_i1~~c18224_g1_i1.p1  ORF type:complete len:322 (+),score=129.36 c18224_g1_i1:230-1195(+)
MRKIVLVFSLGDEKTLENLGSWSEKYLKSLHPGQNPLFFVIGNKSDHKSRSVSRLSALIQANKNNNACYFETSALDGTGVDKAFQHLSGLLFNLGVPPAPLIKTSGTSDVALDYLLKYGVRESDILKKCREETKVIIGERSIMQIPADEGGFLHFLVKSIRAEKVLEVGVFTGYSSICIASALPENGKLLALDISEEYTNHAKRYWNESGLDKKITLRLGAGVDELNKLIQNNEEGTYDFVFIDADKPNYHNYYELCLRLLRKGGIIAIDNVLWHGKSFDDSIQDSETQIIRALNEKIKDDERVTISMLSLGDGVTLCSKN